MYVSLSEIQIKEEEEAMNRPFTKVTCFTSFVKWINDLSLLVIKSIHVQRPLFRWYAFVHLATTVHVFPRLAPVACFPALCAGYMPVFPRFLLSRRNIYLNMSLVAWYWERPGSWNRICVYPDCGVTGVTENFPKPGLDFGSYSWLFEVVLVEGQVSVRLLVLNWRVFVSFQGKVNVPSNRVEQLYEAMLPNLPQYVVSSVGQGEWGVLTSNFL